MAYARTYPLYSLLSLMEQFCNPHLNESDHCAVGLQNGSYMGVIMSEVLY